MRTLNVRSKSAKQQYDTNIIYAKKFYGGKVAVLIRSMCGIDRIKAHKKFTEYPFRKPDIRLRRISKVS